MNLKYTKILSTVLLCSTLSNTYAASDDYVDAYTPGTSSKVGLIKAGLMGIGLMSMASPVEAVPIKGFKGCYLGTIDPQDSPSIDYIRIKTIKSAPCNFYYNYTPSQFTPIDMTMTMSCKDIDCVNIFINSINLCSYSFYPDVIYQGRSPFLAELTWDYLNTKQYEKFALKVLSGSEHITKRPTPAPKPTPYGHIPHIFPTAAPYSFDQVFSNYMNTQKCYFPEPTPLPTYRPTIDPDNIPLGLNASALPPIN